MNSETDQRLEPSVNDFEILVTRVAGMYKVKFVGFPMPRDVHEAQKAVSDDYKVQRNKIADGFNKTKQQLRQIQTEVKVAERKVKAAETQLTTTAQKGT